MPDPFFRILPILTAVAAVACALAAGPAAAEEDASRSTVVNGGSGPALLAQVRKDGGVCCRRGNRTWWMPSKRVCAGRNGHVVADRSCPEKCCVKPGQQPFLTRGACPGGTFGSIRRCRDGRARKKTTTRGAGRPPVALCCRKGTRRWKVSSKAACLRRGGRIVGMKLCGESRARKKTTTRGLPPRHGKKKDPQKGKPAKPGKPAGSHGKPTGIPPGCHRRLTVTRAGTFTKAGGAVQARIAWGATARARHGLGYSWAGAQGKKLSCKRQGAVVNCTASAFPCPH